MRVDDECVPGQRVHGGRACSAEGLEARVTEWLVERSKMMNDGGPWVPYSSHSLEAVMAVMMVEAVCWMRSRDAASVSLLPA